MLLEVERLGLPPTHQLPTGNKSYFNRLFSIFQLRAEEDNKIKKERPEKVVVGGGSGFVGREVCVNLRKAGYEVIILSRSSGNFRMTWDELKESGLPQGTKAVVNLAGQNVLDPFSRWSPAFKTLCRESRIETTRALANAINTTSPINKPKVFVCVSGVGYYAPHSDKEYDEGGEKGNDWLSDLVVDWEAATEGCGKDVRRVFLRPGVVLGRNGGMIQQIYLPFFLGLGGRMGAGTQPLPWIHVKDLAGLVRHSIEEESMEGVYNAVAPQVITNQNFVDAFAGALRRPAFFPLPEFVWNLVFGEERAVMITRGQKVLPRRTLESGFKFRYPTISEACREFSAFPYKDQDLMPNL